jgi:hypothetical protein
VGFRKSPIKGPNRQFNPKPNNSAKKQEIKFKTREKKKVNHTKARSTAQEKNINKAKYKKEGSKLSSEKHEICRLNAPPRFREVIQNKK